MIDDEKEESEKKKKDLLNNSFRRIDYPILARLLFKAFTAHVLQLGDVHGRIHHPQFLLCRDAADLSG